MRARLAAASCARSDESLRGVVYFRLGIQVCLCWWLGDDTRAEPSVGALFPWAAS